jgi:hypothetical protein
VTKFRIKLPLIVYTDQKKVLHALNLLTDEEHTLGKIKKFHLAQDLLAFTDESEALYSFINSKP